MDRKKMVLEGKRILFFAPNFFGYECKIQKKMEEMGAVVDRYDERSVKSSLSRALLKVIPVLFFFKSELYYQNILSENRNKKYDYIFVLKCDMIPKNILRKMKKLYPDAKMCLYLWDAVSNIPGVRKKIKYFDAAYSFDPSDCKLYPNLKLRSLFFDDDFKNDKIANYEYKYDLCFCGTIHSDRYNILQKIGNICKATGISFYSFTYLQSRTAYIFYKLFKKEFRKSEKKEFSFVKMSGQEIAKVVNESKVILDIQHPKQTGLTMRTIEMIGMNKKIVTTNTFIKYYDFYNKANICIIDRENIKLDKAFIEQAYIPITTEMYEKYSLYQWIIDILVEE